jgi:hypothetical protein
MPGETIHVTLAKQDDESLPRLMALQGAFFEG